MVPPHLIPHQDGQSKSDENEARAVRPESTLYV